MTDGDSYRWWGQPLDAQRFHIFEGQDGICESLCGNWAFRYHEDEPELDLDNDNPRDGKDCKACCREADLLDGDDR